MKIRKIEWKHWAREQAEAWHLQEELEVERKTLRDSGKTLSAPEAIRRRCLRCKGYRIEHVRRCDDSGCWLYHWRTGKARAQRECCGAPSAIHDDASIPAGRYTAVLFESDMFRTRRNGRCLALTFRIIGGEFNGRIIRSKLFLEHPHWGRRNEALEDLHSICRSVDVLRPQDSSELHGIPLVLHVDRRQERGGTRSIIEGYEREQNETIRNAAQKATTE